MIQKQSNILISILLITLSLFVISSCKGPTSKTKKTIQIESFKDSISLVVEPDREILLDTVTDISTPMHYEIIRTNYLRDSIITKTTIAMKDFLYIEYKLDSLIPIIFANNMHAIDIGFNNPEKKIDIVKNDYSTIRANNIYFDALFIFNEKKHKIKYSITYSGKRKGKFRHVSGLMKK
jgi:hypothetical protein